MAQIHCYIPDNIAEKLKKKAKKNHLPTSKYLAKLIKNDVASSWPEGYFEQVFGQWEGKPLQRPAQGELETRDSLK